MEYKTLYNGVKIPQLGFGVYQIKPEECERCVLDAIKVGYRHFDTAQSYFNEEYVGSAIKKSGTRREEFFITSKVWIENYGYEACRKSVLRSLEKLQTDYIDLMLLHQPFSDYYGAWRALEELYEEGKIKAIGVSNFYPDRLVDIANFARIKPMVNQVETNPFNQQIEAQKWMEKYDIQIEAWAPLGEGRNNMFSNPVLVKIAKKHNKSVPQVILRWLLQRGIVIFPKTTKIERMKENFNLFNFKLSDEDMEEIKKLDTKTSLFFSHTDPKIVEWFVSLIKERKGKVN